VRNSFFAWMKKETLEGMRSYRFLILGATVLFFAVFDPVMIKLLPMIMKSQVGADFSDLVPATRDYAFGSFIGDLFEIGSLVVCLVLGGTVARERKERAFVIPFAKGADFSGIIAAKALVYAFFLLAVTVPSVFISYAYSGILFPGDRADLIPVLRAAVNCSLYFAYLVAVVTLASSLAPSGLAASLSSLVVAYGVPALGSLLKIESRLPSFLAIGAWNPAGGKFPFPELSAVAAIVICLTGAVGAMKRAEL
jgi:ABC-2 type transport system permease protein